MPHAVFNLDDTVALTENYLFMGWFNIQYFHGLVQHSLFSWIGSIFSWVGSIPIFDVLSQRSLISHLLSRRSSQSCEGRHRRWGEGRQAWRHWKGWWKILNRWKHSETGAFYQVRQWNPSWRADRGLNTLYMKVGRCINMARSILGRISKPSQAFLQNFCTSVLSMSDWQCQWSIWISVCQRRGAS